MNIRLTTPHQRKVPKADKLRAEVERLTRANTYIENEPLQRPYYERNLLRIRALEEKIRLLEGKK